MCTEVLVKRGSYEAFCETVGELAAALGVRPDVVSGDQAGCCLCNAKLGALGARYATDAEGFPHPDYVIEVTP